MNQQDPLQRDESWQRGATPPEPAPTPPQPEPVAETPPAAAPEPPKDAAVDTFDQIAESFSESFAEFKTTAMVTLFDPLRQLSEPTKKVIRSWVSLIEGVRDKVEDSARKKD